MAHNIMLVLPVILWHFTFTFVVPMFFALDVAKVHGYNISLFLLLMLWALITAVVLLRLPGEVEHCISAFSKLYCVAEVFRALKEHLRAYLVFEPFQELEYRSPIIQRLRT